MWNECSNYFYYKNKTENDSLSGFFHSLTLQLCSDFMTAFMFLGHIEPNSLNKHTIIEIYMSGHFGYRWLIVFPSLLSQIMKNLFGLTASPVVFEKHPLMQTQSAC